MFAKCKVFPAGFCRLNRFLGPFFTALHLFAQLGSGGATFGGGLASLAQVLVLPQLRGFPEQFAQV
jgi:hypothetical protein